MDKGISQMIDKNLNKIVLDTKVKMVQKNGSHRSSNEVIVLGITGSGKSTLVRILAGKDVKIKNEGGLVELVYEGIQGGNVSYTDLPEFINDNINDLTFIDTPGFLDTNGYVEEIKNAFSIHDSFNSNNIETKVKILLVIKAAECEVARSLLVQNLFNRLDEMFPNLTESDKKAVGIVFTCEIRNKNPKFYIDRLKKKASGATKKWSEYFEEHQEQMYILPEADGEDGQSFTFNAKNPLLDFVKKDQLVNPKPEFSFSNDAKLYLRGSFTIHVYDLLQEAEKIFHKIDDIIKTLTDIKELDKWSAILYNISKIQIKSPCILKDAIKNNIVDGENIFKKSFERLEDLNALHLFFIDALKIDDREIIDQIKIPIDEEIKSLISKFDIHKKLVSGKQIAEQKMKEEIQKRIEKEREIEENRKRLKFSLENNIKKQHVQDVTKSKLDKGEIFFAENDELQGICHSITPDQILVTSNSVQPGSDPGNVIDLEDKCYISEDKRYSYICFNFLRRKVKIDLFYIWDARNDKNCLINYRVEGSNDANNWITISDYTEKDGTTPRDIIIHWGRVDHPCYPKEDEYKLYYKYIRFTQTGNSYNSNSFVMEIKAIEFFGNISEPIDI